MAPVLGFAVVVLVTVGGLVAVFAVRGTDTDDTPTTEPTVATTTTPTTVPQTSLTPGAADDVSDVALGPDGTLWSATSAGVVAWDLESDASTVFSEADGLGGRSVEFVAAGPDGTVWAAGDSWLARYDGSWTTVTDDVVDADLLTPISSIAVGPDGAIWVAAGGPDALIRVDADDATTYALPDRIGFGSPWADWLAVDQTGTVWVSASEVGLFTFDGAWRHLGSEDGLPVSTAGNVAIAADGSVWVGGHDHFDEPDADRPAGGITRYDGTTWTTYTTADGLFADSGEVVIGPSGDVWVIHGDLGLPEHGLSRYDGSAWASYPGDYGGRGDGVVTDDGMLWMAFEGGIEGFDGTTTRLLVAGDEAVPPRAPPGPPTEFQQVTSLDPVRLTTAIGEIEFTTWVHPEGDEPPWFLTETAHGVVGGMGPDGTTMWSADGIVWNEIPFAAEPDRWSDLPTDAADLVVWSVDDGVARARWDGNAWVDAEIHHDARLDGASVTSVGPTVIVVVRDEIYVWDGTGFAPASRPPDTSLDAGSSAACATRNDLGWSAVRELGPVLAADDGFVALAARHEDDWHTFMVCEPIVWYSTDGDEWLPLADESPFGAGAVVRDVAVVGNTMLAGGDASGDTAAVWVSDDGIAWERSELDGPSVLQVAGSASGWVAVGDANTMWLSPDGRVWDGPYERPTGWAETWNAVDVAMLDDRIIGTGEPREVALDASTSLVVGVFVDE